MCSDSGLMNINISQPCHEFLCNVKYSCSECSRILTQTTLAPFLRNNSKRPFAPKFFVKSFSYSMLLSQAHVSGVFNAFAYQMFLGTVARAARVDPGSPASSMSSTSSIESEEEAISARRPVTQYNGEPPDY